MRRLLCSVTLTLSSLASAAPIKIEFWHAMGGVQTKVAQYANEFNKAQTQYEVVPVNKGNYLELLPALQNALKSGTAPALAQLELTQIGPVAAQGQLTDLSALESGLSLALIKDLYGPVWKVGNVGSKRFGLPWNLSVPVLLYNAGSVRHARLSAPVTWTELETQSRRLAVGGRRPLVVVPDAWTFEANVLSRGGQLVRGNEPTLNSPEAVEALTQLARMSQAKLAQPRGLSEAAKGAFDFARGQNVFVLASVANWTDARKLPFMQLGIASFPCEKPGACAVPLGGGALVIPKGAGAQQQAGAAAFWQFLMDPARLADWVKTTAYVPPRQATLPLLSDWYAKNPQLRAAHAQIDRAVPRPSLPAYAEWSGLIGDAIRKAVNGQASPQAALDEAQKQAKQ